MAARYNFTISLNQKQWDSLTKIKQEYAKIMYRSSPQKKIGIGNIDVFLAGLDALESRLEKIHSKNDGPV